MLGVCPVHFIITQNQVTSENSNKTTNKHTHKTTANITIITYKFVITSAPLQLGLNIRKRSYTFDQRRAWKIAGYHQKDFSVSDVPTVNYSCSHSREPNNCVNPLVQCSGKCWHIYWHKNLVREGERHCSIMAFISVSQHITPESLEKRIRRTFCFCYSNQLRNQGKANFAQKSHHICKTWSVRPNRKATVSGWRGQSDRTEKPLCLDDVICRSNH